MSLPVDIATLLSIVRNKKASDLHLRAGSPPILRLNGRLEPVSDLTPLTSENTEQLAQTIMNVRQRNIFAERNECDFSFSLTSYGRFRVNVFRERDAVHICLRSVLMEPPQFESLNLPAVVLKLCENRRGLILVTGTTGSGKSTTLATMVDCINSTRTAHIVTIEDPIEYVYTDKKSIISQRELGSDTLSYADALRHVVRQDPDVILIGEMRDPETTAAAITAAQTGHLVLSTVHTIDTVQTITRIVDLFPAAQQTQIRLQLSDTLCGIISQRLIPLSTGEGRIPAVEVLVVTPLIRKLMEEGNLDEIPKQIKSGEFYGMQTFNQSLKKLFTDKKIKLEDAQRASPSPEEFMMAIRGIESSDNVTFFR